MKLSKFLMILAITSVLASGCGSSDKQSGSTNEPTASSSSSEPSPSPTATPEPEVPEVPEPYLKSIEKINAGEIDMAKTYLDLTIKDFAGTEYANFANILKVYILVSEYQGLNFFTDDFTEGASQYRDSGLANKEGLQKLVDWTEDYIEQLEARDAALTEATASLLQNYTSSKSLLLSETAISYPEIDPFGEDLSFFKQVGYPLPTDVELENAIEHFEDTLFNLFSDQFFNEGSVQFVELFFYLGNAIGADELAIQCYNEVIKLTEDDPYNERRIKAQEVLERLGGSTG